MSQREGSDVPCPLSVYRLVGLQIVFFHSTVFLDSISSVTVRGSDTVRAELVCGCSGISKASSLVGLAPLRPRPLAKRSFCWVFDTIQFQNRPMSTCRGRLETVLFLVSDQNRLLVSCTWWLCTGWQFLGRLSAFPHHRRLFAFTCLGRVTVFQNLSYIWSNLIGLWNRSLTVLV